MVRTHGTVDNVQEHLLVSNEFLLLNKLLPTEIIQIIVVILVIIY